MWRFLEVALNVRALAQKLSGGSAGTLAAHLLWSRDPMGAAFGAREPAEIWRAPGARAPSQGADTLRVMTWNVKFGGARLDFFFDGHGERVRMSEAEVLANLEQIGAMIRRVDPDVVMLQEVDRGSDRVAGVDQLAHLARASGLGFAAYASQWRSHWIPSDGIGKVDSGNAILSRYPLVLAERVALPLIPDQSPVVQYFYLKRCLLRARVAIPGREGVWALCTHLSAFGGGEVKRAQLAAALEECARIQAGGEGLVFGADLNALPPGAARWHGFEDVAHGDDDFDAGDFRGQEDLLEPAYAALHPAISPEAYARDEAAHHTHSCTGRVFFNRKIDYLWSDEPWVRGRTLQGRGEGEVETMALSDHAPIVAERGLR